MLNFFKNLFGSGGAGEGHANGNGHATAAPAAPLQARARPVPPAQPTQPAMYQQPAPQPVARPANDGSSVQVPLYTVIGGLPLELKTRIRQTMVADIYIMLPLDRVLTQLGSGAVKITYGELREMAPKVFSTQSDMDQMEVSLPLNEILPQINPGLLARRQSQRQIQVPEDVRGPFGKDCSGVTFADTRTATTAGMATAPTPAPAPAPMPAPVEPKLPPPPSMTRPMQPGKPATPFQAPKPATAFQPPKPTPYQPPRPSPIQPAASVPPAAPIQPARPMMPPVTPIQPARPVPPPPAAPAAPAPAPALESPLIPFRSSLASTPTPRPPTATPPASPPVRPAFPAAQRGAGATNPLPAATPRLPVAGNGNGNGNGRPSLPHPAQTAPAVQEPSLSVPMAALSDGWPEVLRGEIEQLNLSEAHLAIPARMIEPALKQGKIAFSWKVLRSWIRPAVLPTVSAHDGMMLELPLRVIAPLFFSRQKPAARTQQKVEVNEKIPNLFFGFPQPDEAPIAEPIAVPAPAPVAEVPLAPPPSMIEPEPIPDVFKQISKKPGQPDTNFYARGQTGEATEAVEETPVPVITGPDGKRSIGTQFLSRYATPNEVVSRAAALEGVAGALVALPDGLMVASKLSAELNGDTLAAFLPHIFGKVSACTKELRMGELNNLNFTVGNVPWKIFRVNAIFFAAFGRAGQPLPTAQLAALAGELDRKK